ncbi:MAG: fumarylacetoacetate hydrolase family protein [Planctomycetaceae bacterium]|nr:fumarylacetoacetate hydrolase family protein [Planctomycetaceae bacterium]
MRLCRFMFDGKTQLGLYGEKTVVPLAAGAVAYETATHEKLNLPASDSLLDYLGPKGPGYAAALKLFKWVEQNDGKLPDAAELETAKIQLLVPIPTPRKLFLLAGNYNEHIQEGGGAATERAETFPYVFMKPPTTTLVDPGKPIVVPRVSPGAIDWECELAVVIGERCRHVSESEALKCVAGYTVVNDISDRKFRPNPGRKKREKDAFFDWLHGKWHDSFCPLGPCVASAESIADPQGLEMKLLLNDKVMQNASTRQQIFPVAAVIEFVSNIVTLEPGDVISTGTPAGVGNTTGTYVKPGDTLHASIAGIGTLTSPVVGE